MAANGFPAGEREGGFKTPRRGTPEPLGDVFLGFTYLDMKKMESLLKTQIWSFKKNLISSCHTMR